MKNLVFNLRTAKAQAEGCAKVTKSSRMAKILTTLTLLLTLGVGQMWAAVTLYYQKDMPSGNYSASNSAAMTQSSVNSNRYSCSVSLQNGSYGFYIKNGNNFYKVSATATTNESVLLHDYGSSNYGNSNHRVTYNTGAAGDFIFTFDASNNKVCVSKRDGLTIKVAWSTASGHDGDWNLGTYTTLTEEGSTGKYSADVDLTAVKHYMFVQTDNTRYWRGSSTLSVNNSTSLYYYGNSNYGGSGDKINFTPSAAAKYRFTWNHADKTIKLQRLYNISYQKGDYGTGSTQTDYKVYNTTLTLRNSGHFTRTGYHQTAWNTNTNGTGGTSYDLQGSYTLNSAITLYPTWTANQYTITLNGNGGTGHTSSVKATYNSSSLSSSITNPTKTGYNFNGWHKTNGTGQLIINTGGVLQAGTDYTSAGGVWTNAGNVTLFAGWTAKQCSITLDYQTSAEGYSSSGDITNAGSLTATYDAAMTPLTGTMPTAAQGYKFMGFYTGTNGTGTKYYNADGSSANNWAIDTEDPTTLYAYYKKAEITNLTFDAAVVAPSASVGVTPTVAPTPTGTNSICWKLLYNNGNLYDPQPTFSPANPAGISNKVTFNAPPTSGMYLVAAVLRTGSSCDGGTKLDSVTYPFQVAGDHTVTVQYKCGSEVIAPSTTVTGKPLEWTAVGVSNIFGYIFSGWSAGDGVTIQDGEGSSNPTHIKATYDGYLIANYTKIDYIYFKNTMGWSNVYVYFYTSDKYWDNTEYGSGANKDKEFKNGDDDHHKPYWDEKHGQLTQIEGTDIWYFDAGSIGCANWSNIVFNANDQNGHNWFYATELVRRGDFNKGTPMFVPADKKTYDPILKNSNAKYYNKGYWINYLGERTGYTLEIYNSAGNTLLKSIKFLSETKQMPMEVKVDLEENQTYKFQLRRDNDIIYGNDGTMSYTNHGQVQPWKFESGKGKCTFTSTVAGDYTFHLSYSKVASENEYHLRIGIDIPIQTGDYRVIYKDGVHTGWKPSAVVPKVNNGKDTVSFFIRPKNSPQMKIQQATVDGKTGAISWGSDINIPPATLSALPKDSVYNVCLTMNGSGAISLEKIEPYTGNFYIRTDAANSKWDNYRSDPDHLMTYSEYSITHGGYSHYYCHWVTTADAARKNVKFCIANDYSPCISDTLTRETASGEWKNINSFIDANGNLLRSANVRFMWDQHTNTIRRAYLDPAKGDDNFLVLASADGKIANESEVVQTSVVFSDNENWIYEANVKAKANAQIKLVATWGDSPTIVQYFKGSSSSTETLITGSGTDWYDIRLIYDYKTNRLIAAMLPSGNHTNVEPINADVMFIREHQGDISQVTFTGDGALTNIKIAYGVMRFSKWTLNNKDKSTHLPLDDPKSYYERALYFISFPFEVKLSEVFGFGTYAQDWIVEYYDGAERARTGWWEGQPGFWRYVWDRKNFVLEPNKGYLLELELGNFNEESGFWNNDNERLELFFPSSGNLGSITKTTVNCSIPEHACTINRAATEGLPDTGDPRTSYNRTIFDSHWNVMPVPTYVNATPNEWNNTTWTAKIGPKFLYTWNMDDNTLTATSGAGYRYHAMHAYMVQYGGNVEWVTSGTGPASIVARNTYAEEPKEVEFRLEIQQNEKMIDQTFIALSNDETVSADFQFGEDMSKDFNARNANIFTKIGTTFAAGNTMPMTDQKTIVPVGVVVKKTGDYTFSIPDGTNGIGITLIDEETGIRTSLSALDYTVELAAGDYTERFWLEISPVKGAETGIDPGVDARENGVRKVMIDGLLYIVRDGKMYDATGKRVE